MQLVKDEKQALINLRQDTLNRIAIIQELS
jgi:hypothetical protein